MGDWLIAGLYLVYGMTTIYVPKVSVPFELSGIYVMEAVCAVVSGVLFLRNEVALDGLLRLYCVYLGLSLLSWAHGAIAIGSANWKSLFLIFKFGSFAFLIAVGRRYQGFFSERVVRLLLGSQAVFVIVFGGYVLWNTLMTPIPVDVLAAGYERDYRLVGLTGQVLAADGLSQIGPTSVQMGVYTALLALIGFSLARYLRRRRYVVLAGLMLIGTLLTYSRSGLLALGMGLATLGVSDFGLRRSVKWLMVVSGVITALMMLLGVGMEEFVAFGTLAKLADPRYAGSYWGLVDARRPLLWGEAIDYVTEHPFVLVVGTGYGTTENRLGFGTLESLVFDTLFESGVVTLVFLLLFFLMLWRVTGVQVTSDADRFHKAVLRGIHAGIPGIFVSSLVGGNTLQTDFIAPMFYLTLGMCLSRIGESPAPSKTAAATSSAFGSQGV